MQHYYLIPDLTLLFRRRVEGRSSRKLRKDVTSFSLRSIVSFQLFFAGLLTSEVRVLYGLAHHLPNGDAELVLCWPANEVPAIENPVYREVG